MIKQIGPINSSIPACQFPVKSMLIHSIQASTLVSMACPDSSQFLKFFSWILSPLTRLFNWFVSRIGLTTKELETFEKLVEKGMYCGGMFFYDCSIGKEGLLELISSCDDLYQKLSNKWFPNLQGILLIRQNLIKIKMCAFAVLGNIDQIKGSEEQLKTLGYKISTGFKFQIDQISEVVSHGTLIKLVNFCAQRGSWLFSRLFRKK